jgi:hypothetical protein
LILGSVNGIEWSIQPAVTEGSSVLRRISSTQSVSCQPVAVPGPPALAQNGKPAPSATILSARVMSSSHVAGTV